MNARPPTRHQRGFTLLEMLIAVVLAAAVGLIASRLFPLTVRMTQNAERAHDQINSGETALRQLRADVSGARGIGSNGPSTITLEIGDSVVVWTQQPGVLVRTEESNTQHWEHLAEPLNFEAHGPRVVITTASGQRLVLASQLLLVERVAQR